MNNKPRSDSKLDNLKPESRVLELRDMLLAGASHQDCKAWLFAECGGVTTSGDALTRFWKKHCAPIVTESRQLAAVKAEGIIEEAGRTDWNTGTMELVKQVSFEMMSGQRTDPKTAEKFIKLILKADKQDTDKQKFELMKTKAAQADEAAGVANNKKLTAEEKAAELKRIFRMG